MLYDMIFFFLVLNHKLQYFSLIQSSLMGSKWLKFIQKKKKKKKKGQKQ